MLDISQSLTFLHVDWVCMQSLFSRFNHEWSRRATLKVFSSNRSCFFFSQIMYRAVDCLKSSRFRSRSLSCVIMTELWTRSSQTATQQLCQRSCDCMQSCCSRRLHIKTESSQRQHSMYLSNLSCNRSRVKKTACKLYKQTWWSFFIKDLNVKEQSMHAWSQYITLRAKLFWISMLWMMFNFMSFLTSS